MLLEELASCLVTAGLGTLGTDLFLGYQPDTPDVCVSLHETGGLAPRYITNAPWPSVERPSVQVFVRDPLYLAARSRLSAIARTLNALTNTSVQGARYLSVRPLQAPISLGRDGNQRAQLVINFTCERVPPGEE